MKTDNGKALPKRKSTRLKSFDYSAAGIYFITICTRDRMQILSEIVRVSLADADRPIPVGEGLAPPETVGERLSSPPTVGEGLAPPEIAVRLKPCGEIAEEQLRLLEARFPSVTIEKYVIMPDHIHALIRLHGGSGGASPSPTQNGEISSFQSSHRSGGASPCPTLDDVICVFKSLTSRSCKQKCGVEGLFQRSSAEHIIRDREDYETRRKYIYENPLRWYYKHLMIRE